MSKGSPKPDRSMCELLQILCLFGVCWAMMRTVLEDVASWIGLFGKKKQVWRLGRSFHCVKRGVFRKRKRNVQTFEGSELSVAQLKFLFLQSLYTWEHAVSFIDSSNFCLFLIN